MEKHLQDRIKARARTYSCTDDPTHDWSHIQRVLDNACYIAGREGGDLDVIIPAVYFHDAINHPKNDPRADLAPQESADAAENELMAITDYPHEKIPTVKTAIIEHSYGAGITPTLLESKIVQDADRLEATGALSIMRTFCSCGQYKSQFYHTTDPFCQDREPEPLKYALDLFYARLLKVKERMNTQTARDLAERRTEFLKIFLNEVQNELSVCEQIEKTN